MKFSKIVTTKGKYDEQLDKLTDGTFVSIKEANQYNSRKHGWASDEYGIVKTKQIFEPVDYEEEDDE